MLNPLTTMTMVENWFLLFLLLFCWVKACCK